MGEYDYGYNKGMNDYYFEHDYAYEHDYDWVSTTIKQVNPN